MDILNNHSIDGGIFNGHLYAWAWTFLGLAGRNQEGHEEEKQREIFCFKAHKFSGTRI
jgi:hypothetical protein